MTLKMDNFVGTTMGKVNKGPEAVPATNAGVEHSWETLAARRPTETGEFVRERNLLLLSALYYLYGDDWSQSPDWTKVAEAIENKKIPTYGENFTASSCEAQYRALIEKGYQVGMGSISTTLRAPRLLTEPEKRRYILANTSNDLVLTSKLLEEQMQEMYQSAEVENEKIQTGDCDNRLEELFQMKESDSETESNACNNDLDEEYEDPEVEKAAIEIAQLELLQDMVGLKDVLPLVKYCTDAVENAIKKLPPSTIKKKPETSSETTKPERIVDYTKNTISSNPVSQELTDLLHSVLEGTTEEDKSKNSASTPPAPTLAKLLELPVTNPGMPLPEIPSVKPTEGSPQKNTSRPTTRGRSKDRAVADSAKEDVSTLSTQEVSKANNEDVVPATNVAAPVVPSSTAETNGGDCESDPVADKDAVSLTSSEKPLEENVEKKSQPEKCPEEETKVVETETNVANESKSPTKNSQPVEVTVEPVQQSDSQPETGNNENASPTRCDQPEAVAKGKTSPRKNLTSTRPISTRTSSRLTSPEPIPDQTVIEDEKQVKKTVTRQSSNSETHIPVLRSRRGATPTKAVPVEKEKEPVKPTTTSNTKPDVSLPEDNDIDGSDSSRTSPETSDVKSDQEAVPETKPKLKVYSARPPSPLSHVDEKLFADFSDDEDDELVMIDKNVNKTREEKTSPSKPLPRKGRTFSSENDTTSQNNEENSHSKRLTRKSLRIHDAVTEAAAADESNDASHIGQGSEKAASESSFGGKEKKSRSSKTMMRVKKLNEEKQQLFGDGDSEEGSDGKRLTRARAKTGPSQPEKRTKLPSVGDSESLSETEPTPTRSTRSRVSTTSALPVSEASSPQQPSTVPDEEDHKAFRKTALNLLNKISNHKSAVAIQKYMSEDAAKILKHPMDFQTIRRKIETGVTRTFTTIQKDLSQLLCNILVANASAPLIGEQASEFMTSYKAYLEDAVNQRSNSAQKNDGESDAESVESQDEQKSEKESVPKPSGGRRKRRRSASETSMEEVFPLENKRRVTRTSASSSYQQVNRKTKHPISPDIVSANRVRH